MYFLLLLRCLIISTPDAPGQSPTEGLFLGGYPWGQRVSDITRGTPRTSQFAKQTCRKPWIQYWADLALNIDTGEEVQHSQLMHPQWEFIRQPKRRLPVSTTARPCLSVRHEASCHKYAGIPCRSCGNFLGVWFALNFVFFSLLSVLCSWVTLIMLYNRESQ